FVTCFIRIRLEWNVKRSGAAAARRASMAGISVSIVVFELGTMSPMRYVRVMCLPSSVTNPSRGASSPPRPWRASSRRRPPAEGTSCRGRAPGSRARGGRRAGPRPRGEHREDFVRADDVRVLLLEVEERRVVRAERAVADAVADDDRTEAEADRVDDARTHAAARRAARDEDRVDAVLREPRREVGAEEGGGVALGEDELARTRRELRDDLRRRVPLGQARERGDLEAPDVPVAPVLGEDDPGVGDRQAAPPARLEERHGARDYAPDVSAA